MSAAATSMTIATVGIVGVGKVVKGEGFDVRSFFAAGVVALSLSLLANVDEHLANLFAGAILLTAMYLYVPAIVDKTGLAKK